MTSKVVLILLVIAAVMVVRTDKLRRGVVYMGVLSMIGAFAYLLYAAPDVAIAEAVIGSSLVPVLQQMNQWGTDFMNKNCNCQ